MSNEQNIDSALVTGMSPRFVWRTVALIWAACGLIQIVSYVFVLTPKPLPLICVVTGGLLPVALAMVWFAMARARVELGGWFHLQVVLAFVLIIGTSALDVNDHSADAVYPLLPMVVAVIVLPARESFVYVIAGSVGAAAMVVTGDDPNPQQRAVVMATLAATSGAVLMIVHNQIRKAIRLHHEFTEIDELTGLANTRRLTMRLGEEFAREQREGDVGLVMLTIDLNEFKDVNDSYGHSVGDRVLLESGRAIESQLEEGDLAARRGGDEFTVLAFDRPERRVSKLRDRIASAIERRRAALCPDVAASASIGMVRRADHEPLSRFIERGDAELHDAKQTWRSRAGRELAADWRLDSAETIRPIGSCDECEPGSSVASAPITRSVAELPRNHEETVRKIAWQLLAAYGFLIAAIVPVLGMLGQSGGSLTPAIVITCNFAALMGATCLFMSYRSTEHWEVEIALAVSFVLTIALAVFGGEARNALVEFLVCPAVIAFYATSRRVAVAYVAACMLAYTLLLTTLDYELVVIRSIQTAAVVMLLALLISRGLARAEAAMSENERLSGVDPLTGLANLRRLRRRLDDEIARTHAVGGKVTLYSIDLDNFKEVNDRFSHSLGDEVLRAVGAALADEVRAYDLAARRGGDEFMVVAPNVDESRPEEVAHRLADAVAAARAGVCSEVMPTASIGFVTSKPGEDAESLIARADESEREAKLRSRASVRLRAVA